MHELELSFVPTLDNAQWATIAVRQVAAALMKTTRASDTEEMDTFLSEIELATGEACCNAVKHGPGKGKEKVRVTISYNHRESKFIISVHDGNQAYELSDREPDFEAVPENGYGIYIMKTLMDKVTYRRDKGRNTVIMEKQILQGEE